jgi:hypothetical protein
MKEITLQLDVVATPRAELTDWDKANGTPVLEDLLGEQAGEEGPVVVTLVNPCGPGGGNPVIMVKGTPGRLLGWLLVEYTNGNLNEALDLLAEPGKPTGSYDPARV